MEVGGKTMRSFLHWDRSFDVVWTGVDDKQNYGKGPRTDENGRVALPALIPGATYLVSQFKSKARVFTAKAGEELALGDITIFEPQRTKELPTH
jgi:hypothetical protein